MLELDKHSVVLYSIKELSAKEKVRFIREFNGYSITKSGRTYTYPGFLQSIKGRKMSNNLFIVPAEQTPPVEAYLKARGIVYAVKY